MKSPILSLNYWTVFLSQQLLAIDMDRFTFRTFKIGCNIWEFCLWHTYYADAHLVTISSISLNLLILFNDYPDKF